MFSLCLFSYGGLHISRNAWSYCTDTVKKENDWDDKTIGHINFIFMLGYGSGLWLNGWLVDKVNPRYFYAFGLFSVGCLYGLISYLRRKSKVVAKYFYAL